jgi:hypothetical protein
VQLTQKIAIAAGALTLAAGGVAAAAGSPSVEADKGLTSAEEQVGVELPASQDAHPGEVDETETEAPETESTEVEAEVDDEGVGPVDNHGAEVSAVATSDETTGREHGEAVSAVARDNAGAPHVADDSTDDHSDDDEVTDDQSDDHDVDADEVASSHGRP